MRHYKTEEDFFDECYMFARDLLNFVKSISGENRWWFEECYKHNYDEENYSVIFKSYITPEYRNFILGVSVKKIGDKYEFKIAKQVTELA